MGWEIEKDVLYPGTVVVPGPSGKPLSYTFTAADVERMNRTGNAKIADRWNVPLVFEHQNECPDRRPMLQLSQSQRDAEYARGVFGCAKGYRVKNGRLVAVLAGDDDEDLKRFKKIKFVSPEIEWNWRDSDGKVWAGPTITHIAATPRPVQRHQQAVQLSQNAGKPRVFDTLSEFIETAAEARNVAGTIHPSVIRLSLNDYEAAPMADETDDAYDTAGGKGKKGNWCQRIVDALAGAGIKLPDCGDTAKDPEHFADLVETACLNCEQAIPDDDELPPPEEDEDGEPTGDIEQPPEGSAAPPGPPIQMSLTKATERAAAMTRKAMLGDIAELEKSRRITPAVAEDLRSKLKTIRLSFRRDDGEMVDNAVSVRIEAFQQNPAGSAFSTVSKNGKPAGFRWGLRNGKRVKLSLKRVPDPEYAAEGANESPAKTKETLNAWDKMG